MTIRDQRQQEFANIWINSGKHGILNLCPRFGKIYTTINIIEKLKPKSILIAYPDNKIKQSWKDDFTKRGFNDSNVTYTTHLSLKKFTENMYDLVVIDEIHLLSEAQIEAAKEILESLDLDITLCGLGKDDSHNTAYLMNSNYEKIDISPDSNVFFFSEPL